jgi:hypothetical protein
MTRKLPDWTEEELEEKLNALRSRGSKRHRKIALPQYSSDDDAGDDGSDDTSQYDGLTTDELITRYEANVKGVKRRQRRFSQYAFLNALVWTFYAAYRAVLFPILITMAILKAVLKVLFWLLLPRQSRNSSAPQKSITNVSQRGGTFTVYDERGRIIRSISTSPRARLEGYTSQTFAIRVGSTVTIYDVKGRIISSRSGG